jgi:hypothetical protein
MRTIDMPLVKIINLLKYPLILNDENDFPILQEDFGHCLAVKLHFLGKII